MFRVAIIGYRVQGSRHHAPAFAKLPDCCIAAVCDVVPERAEEGAALYDVPAYTDVDRMLCEVEFDIAVIPVGEKYRYELVMKCLEAGKHIFTEKPLAAEDGQFAIKPADVPVAREMIDEWQQRPGLAFGVCFGLHGSTNVQWAKEVIRSGKLGEFAGLHAIVQHNSWNHVIDLVRCFGGDVDQVFAHGDDPGEMNVKAATLKFANGGAGTLAAFRTLALQFQVKWVGTKGEVIVDNIGGDARWYLHDSLETTVFNEARTLRRCSYLTIFDTVIADYVAALRDGTPFAADGWAGLRHIEIDASITESIRTGEPAPVERHHPEMVTETLLA